MSHVLVVAAKSINTVVVKNNLIATTIYQDLYIGIMSGTSLDGVDAVLYDFATQTVVDNVHFAYSETLKSVLLQLAHTATLESIATLERAVTELYIKSVSQLLQRTGISASQIKAIGLHGQTIYHKPREYSWQLGLGALLAQQSGITVINDFRNADIAAGGEGAPLTPKYHQYLLDGDGVVVNLGGIANITLIQNGVITGFDSGPANILLDNYMRNAFNKDYDRDGLVARSGFILPETLEAMLADDYFHLPPPKSTGVEYFNMQWLERFFTGSEKPQDVMRTLVELSAMSISKELDNAGCAYFCGGGVFNKFLLERIAVLAHNCEILTTDELGVHPQLIEAIAFAYFAKLHLEQIPANIPSVTGANKEVILGVKHKI